MMTVLGIDINRSGAAPLLDESGASLDDRPKGRPAVNAALLAGNIANASATHAYVEHVGPRLTDGAMQGFVFGHCQTAERRSQQKLGWRERGEHPFGI
jgi:hypothetical protein